MTMAELEKVQSKYKQAGMYMKLNLTEAFLVNRITSQEQLIEYIKDNTDKEEDSV